jgi:hypothetical protein
MLVKPDGVAWTKIAPAKPYSTVRRGAALSYLWAERQRVGAPPELERPARAFVEVLEPPLRLHDLRRRPTMPQPLVDRRRRT